MVQLTENEPSFLLGRAALNKSIHAKYLIGPIYRRSRSVSKQNWLCLLSVLRFFIQIFGKSFSNLEL